MLVSHNSGGWQAQVPADSVSGERYLPGSNHTWQRERGGGEERIFFLVPFKNKDTNAIYEGTILMTYLPLKGLTSEHHHMGN